MRLAILEDDPALADQMAKALVGAGHHPHRFGNGASLIAALKRDTFDLLLLDWTPPGTSGHAVLAWASQHLESAPPVLFVTNRTDEAEIVHALGLGADDYLVKPIAEDKLLARVDGLLRRTYPAQAAYSRHFDGVRFDMGRRGVAVGDANVAVTNKEFDLALLFFQNLDRPLSRAYLMEKIWGFTTELQTRTLDAHVSRIRSKLGLRPECGYRLSPVYSYGYRLEKFDGKPERD